MAVWAFNYPGEQYEEFLVKSLKKGISRFGWSYYDGADLNLLAEKPWGKMNDDEIATWSKSSFLLNIEKDDWIVHINLPYWGAVTAGKVIDKYAFEKNDTEISDMRHFFRLDVNSIITFERDNHNVHPLINRKLKLRGKHWRIYNEKEFFQTIENVKNNSISIEEGGNIGLHYLKDELSPFYKKITEIVHNTHPEKKLEYFIADVLRSVPNVTDVKVNGSGWGTDYGADVIVKYNSGIDIFDLKKEETLVVQIKSYEGDHWDTNAVTQIETAITKFKADSGMIITTANSTNHIEAAIETASEKIGVPISLVAGEDVAKFILKYGRELLFDI